MKIGFDLDKVFINYPPFVPGALIDKLYKKENKENLRYRFPSKPEQILRRFSHSHLFRPPLFLNIEFLKSLDNKKNKLYLISSRFGFLKKQTNYIIKRYDIEKYFDAMYFNFDNKQPHEFKNDVIKFLKLDIYIDDDLALLRFVRKGNKDTRFFWLNAHDSKKLYDNMWAVKRLDEITLKKT